MVAEIKGEVIPFDLPTPGLDKFIEENDGNIEHALKALWLQYQQEMEWKDYAIGANRSILKLTTTYRKLIPAIRDACGKLAHAEFKDPNGLSLEFAKSFQDLITIGSLIKENDLPTGNTLRRIKRINQKDRDLTEIVYDCGHSEECPTVSVKNQNLQLGMALECPTCVRMLDEMKKSL